ncbi:MAG TPA: hypothetical protein VI653_15425 [Steroidobacteraceae bacterium]
MLEEERDARVSLVDYTLGGANHLLIRADLRELVSVEDCIYRLVPRLCAELEEQHLARDVAVPGTAGHSVAHSWR